MSLTLVTGNVVKTTAVFDQSGVVTDPSGGISLLVTDPNGSQTTYTYGVGNVITRVDLGTYMAQILGNIVGTWTLRWVSSSGLGQSAKQDSFVVTAS